MEDLRTAVEHGNVVLIVGTGMSAATTGNAPTATWIGLIESGRARVETLGVPNASWLQQVEQTLEYGRTENDVGSLIRAASMVKGALAAYGPQAYADWLREDVGKLQVTSRDLASAVLALPFPILTTNYDTLMEQVGGRPTACWDVESQIQKVLVGTESNAIGHLHGVWDSPDSIILSDVDYQRHIGSQAIQSLEKAISGIKSLVYVGYGAGLDDPNFGALLNWHRSTFKYSANRHFRLCLDSEFDDLNRQHAGDAISVIAYGPTYSDLPKFLRDLSKSTPTLALTEVGIARDVVAEAQEAFVDTLVADVVIIDPTSAAVSVESIVPPPLLPVPYAQYAKAKSAKEPDNVIDRLTLTDEVKKKGVLIVVADEGAGLTTAIRWLAWQASLALDGAAPLYVDFASCKRGPHPLGAQLSLQARLQGLIARRGDPLPRHVAALDNMTPYVNHVSDPTISDLAAQNSDLAIVGCLSTSYEELVHRLKQAGVEPRVRFLGRMESVDIRYLAKIASPAQHDRLARAVIAVLQQNGLPRTPLTASLLILILLRGESIFSAASQTAILDQYVSLLLGRGDPHEDSRVSIDQPGREAVLGSLARVFVEKGVAGLSEGEVVECFSEAFRRFGWIESPVRLLDFFLDRRVLRLSSQVITFSQYSYLYLFAAKRAQSDITFRDLLLKRPLFYSSILVYYAGLSRKDSQLLETVSTILEERAIELQGDYDSPLEIARLDDLADGDLLPADGEGAADVSSDDDDDPAQTEDLHPSLELFDQYNLDVEARLPLFVDESDLPLLPWMGRALDLISTLVRDLDQIEDLELKRAVLVRTLQGWGKMLEVINQDSSFREVIPKLAEALETVQPELDKHDREEFLKDLIRTLPATVVLGSIATTLATRTLLVILKNAQERGELTQSNETLVGAAFLIFAIGEQGWPKQLRELLRGSENIWIVRNFFFWVCFSSYVASAVHASDESELVELCVEILERGVSLENRDRAGTIAEWRRRIEWARRENRTRRSVGSGQ